MTDTSASTGGYMASHLRFDGAGKSAVGQARSRIGLAMALVAAVYLVIGGRLVQFALMEPGDEVAHMLVDTSIVARRPDLVDRNGVTLATDINTASLYAEPRRVVDADEAVEQLAAVLPDLDIEGAHKRLTSKAGFVWLKRELTPAQQSQILQLGIPGIGFRRKPAASTPRARSPRMSWATSTSTMPALPGSRNTSTTAACANCARLA